jgi:hypothetical protein
VLTVSPIGASQLRTGATVYYTTHLDIPRERAHSRGSPALDHFRSEWTVLIFGCWCADVHYRGVMWHLRPKLRDWIRQMGETELLEGSGLNVSTTLLALVKHDA